ncbi:MAG: hypothetical protein H5T84_02200 [Thermoleophilia bacterium]|nr:hypothetical protein [Thermoleophilia bacterium]
MPSTGGLAGGLTDMWLRRHSRELAAAFRSRRARDAAVDEQLAALERKSGQKDDPQGPAVLSIRPPQWTPEVARLETDASITAAALAAGRKAAQDVVSRIASLR